MQVPFEDDSSDIRYKVKTLRSENGNGHAVALCATLPAMGLVSDWVIAAVARVGGQAELARRLSKELRANYDRSAVQKMCAGRRDVTAEEMLAIEATADYAIPSSRMPTLVPLVDWVSAGKLANSDSQLPVENLRTFGDLGEGKFFALRVEGTSMDRISPPGSIIIVNQADKTLISGKYYVFAERGDTTYKRWHGGDPPYLEPYSTDPSHEPIFIKNRKRLSVVGRVKRTVLDL